MPNPFANWTPEMVIAHNAQVRAKNKRAAPAPAPAISVKQVAKKKKPLLNKTEALFKAELERRGETVLAQAITFKLADALSYRPDFVTVEPIVSEFQGLPLPRNTVTLTAYETKGPHRFKREGINKLKMAATAYPWIKWILVERDKNQWTEKEITQ
jgi:hypothetical protein